jgi:ribosomal protein S14
MGPKNGKISRMKFRELCEFGKISGVKRATW